MYVFVANAIAPYAYEAVSILGLPSGAVFRARYPENWLVEDLQKNPQKLVKSTAIYCLRDYATAEIIPLRRIKVTEARMFGNIVFIKYRFDKIASLDLDPDFQVFKQSLSELIKELGISNKPNNPMETLVFPVKNDFSSIFDYRDGRTETDAAWMKQVQGLCDWPVFEGMTFVRPNLIDRQKGLRILPDDGVLSLRTEKRYDLHLTYVLNENNVGKDLRKDDVRDPNKDYMEKGPYFLRLSADSSQVNFSPNEVSLSGRYDEVTIQLVGNQAGATYDFLKIEYSVPESVMKSFSPVLNIPYIVKTGLPRYFWKGTAIVAILAFLLVLNFSSSLDGLVSQGVKDFASNFGMVVFAYAAFGIISDIGDALKK